MVKTVFSACLFVATLLALFVARAAPHPLEKGKEARILFMLFEGQNRRTVVGENSNCKAKSGPERDWTCDHKTVKSVLMDAMFLGLPGETFAKQNRIQCEQLDKTTRSAYKEKMGFEWGPKEFRREVAQALDGQWLCTFTAHYSKYEELARQREEALKNPASTTSTVANKDAPVEQLKLVKSAPEAHTTAFGLTFLLNRDQSRIVSRNIVAWSNF